MRLLKELASDLLTLAFPQNCAGCGRVLNQQENLICLYCKYDLPKTEFHHIKDNPIEKMLWGRFPFEYATAYLFFEKGSKIRKMLHALKYKGAKEIGHHLGYQMGINIKNAPIGQAVDVVVPVPLHPKKLRMRGYNQATCIAEGLARALEIPCEEEVLKRVLFTQTQTRKDRLSRYENIQSVFESPTAEPHKHYLIVDDVMTTGSTLEGCAQAMLKKASCKISVATLAYTS